MINWINRRAREDSRHASSARTRRDGPLAGKLESFQLFHSAVQIQFA